MELVVVEDAEHQLGERESSAANPSPSPSPSPNPSPNLEEGEQRVGDGGVAAHVQAERHVEGHGEAGDDEEEDGAEEGEVNEGHLG